MIDVVYKKKWDKTGIIIIIIQFYKNINWALYRCEKKVNKRWAVLFIYFLFERCYVL